MQSAEASNDQEILATIGTRGSPLALIQASEVRDRLARAHNVGSDRLAIKVIRTSGDLIQDRPLYEAGGKGLFVKEIEQALLAGTIDIAVHSAKDVPTFLPDRLWLSAWLPREDPRDVFISAGEKTLSALPKAARVGTSSVRRVALVRRARPDVETALLRGNVDTRLRKLDDGGYDAIILALAGLRRLGVAERATMIIETEDWLPALGQGAVGVEIRTDDARAREALGPLDHAPSAITLACERAFQAALDGSCRTPIGGLAKISGAKLSFHGEVLAPDGSDFVETRFDIELGRDPVNEAAKAGRDAGLALKPKAARWLS